MWKKTEESPQQPAPTGPPSAAPAARRAVATIGPSIAVHGDLTGEEDLLIEGRLEGEISLKKNNVTVGKSGRVKADIYGRTVRVEGEVRGNLYGEQEIVIRASGRVHGNITAPRVTLENGSKFKGSIDMEPARKPAPAPVRRERPPAPDKQADAAPAAADKPGEAKAAGGLEPTASRG